MQFNSGKIAALVLVASIGLNGCVSIHVDSSPYTYAIKP